MTNQETDSETSSDMERTCGGDDTTGDITNNPLCDMLQKISGEIKDLETIQQTTASVKTLFTFDPCA